MGRRPNTGVRLGRLINQNSHVIRVPELSAAPPKRCNSNDAISMFEIHVGELRATFLRNHSMRRHKDPSRRQLKPKRHPKQKTTQAEDPRNPDNRHKRGGGAPDMGRCTRYVAVHPNRRGALPTDRVQHPNTQEQTRNWHTEPLTTAPLHAQLGPTGGRMGTLPTPPPALRPTPAHSDTSYTPTCEEPDYLSAYTRPQARSLAEITCRNAPTGAPTNPALDVPQTSSPQLDEPQINEIAAADPMGDSCGASGPEPAPNGTSAQPETEEAPAQPTA